MSPVIAAVFYSSWSLSGIIFLDVIGAFIAVFTLFITVIPEIHQDVNRGKVQVLREAKEGFRFLRTNKGMLGLVLISSLYTLALMPTSTLFPLLSMSYFGGTSTNASIVEVVFSVGLLFGSLYTPLLQGNFEAKYLGRILSLTNSIRLISGPLGLAFSGRFLRNFTYTL